MWGLLILVAVWVLVAPIFALASASRANRRANALLRRLETLEGLAGVVSADAARAAATARPYAPLPPETAGEPEPQSPSATPFGPEAAAATSDRDAAGPLVPEAFPAEAPPVTPPPPSPRESLELKIGARWSVLVGGLALALGAVFLVRYSIERGLIGPGLRIALGLFLAALLFAAGEWLRRRDQGLRLPVFEKADVPAILTAAGGVALFATIYAAYALYGFIGPASAFILLTLAGLATLVLSVIHGPALAVLGALGSYVAPLLVASNAPSPFAIVLHVLAVTGTVLAMARIRGWRWLASIGVAASFAWGAALAYIDHVDRMAAELLFLAGLFAAFVAGLLAGVHRTSLKDRDADPLALIALAGVAMLSLYYSGLDPHFPLFAVGIVLAGALGGAASRWPAAAPAVLFGGALAVLTTMLAPLPPSIPFETFRVGAFEWMVANEATLPDFALRAAMLMLVVGVGSLLSADRAAAIAPRTAGTFAAAGAAAPLLILVVIYLRYAPLQTRPAIGLAALVMAAVFAAITERLIAERPADDKALAPSFYAAGAVLCLSFAFAVGLVTRFIPLALSLGAAGVAWVSLYRPVKVLTWLAVVVAALACAAIVFGPPFSPAEIGTTPILNGLILRLGLPAAAVLFAGETLRRHRDGIEAGILQAIGLVIAAFFVALEIRHFAGGGVISTGPTGLGEQGALTLAALAFSLGLQEIAKRTRSKVYAAGSLVAGVISAAAIAIAHFVTANPLLTGEDVGTGHFFNLLLPGYLMPAIAAAWVAAAAQAVRPRWYVLLIAALSLLLAFAYLTLMVRHGFHGAHLGGFAMTDAENWTYSAVWLAFGILILAGGILVGSAMIRAASGLVIAVVVFKVFLFDMAALTGALRAASFLGLGAVLIVIGRLYQRLFSRAPTEPAAS